MQLHWDRQPPPAIATPPAALVALVSQLGEDARIGGAAGVALGAVPAGGGGWIIFSLTPPDGGRLTFDSGGLFSMLAMALGIGIVAVPMVGWMTRPLRRLAEAADRVGRDPRPVMLATDGPVEVRHAAAAFNAMQARIARLIEDRTEALAALSHDLRTPLARLKLRAGFMMEGEERVRMEADIAEMEAMVSRTLEYFREGRDAEPAVPTDLAAILQTLADDAADAGHDVTYCGPAQAVLPLRRLAAKRAFTNLLNNALQHGAPPVTITLAARDAGWSTEISDAGPGIAPSEFERAVSPFVRLDAARGGSGVGLGLTIAQRFATAEGGRLTLAQAPSGGLLVQVHLPG
jgi:signal transduction histidine kinase